MSYARQFSNGTGRVATSFRGPLRATQDIADAVRASEITFIVVATPSEPSGEFSLRYALPVARLSGKPSAPSRSFIWSS